MTCIRMGVVCYRVVCLDRLSTHESLTKAITTMWYLLTIIIGAVGSFIAMAGEPMGAILFIPMVVIGVWEEIKGTIK
ncbi:MAG: hypothetical protein II260_05250 [Muribaculaceae bacterium]|nr:hypothetical protein [Muribaculaceae bacterium]